MNDLIKNIIINKKRTVEDRNKELDELAKDIEIAKEFLSGKYAYCKDCDDFYLTKSFFAEIETYVDGYVDIVYKICPKGHKHEIDRKERKVR